jgi:hypothetical protein
MRLLRKLLLERKDKRPPFLKAPLNAPGASLREQLDDKAMDLAFGLVSGPVMVLITIGFSMLKDGERLAGLCGAVIIAWIFWLVFWGRNLKEDIRTTRLGYLGEVLVGQELESARSFGCSVYHDILAENGKFNVDHVLIGEMGVIVFETKARSKPLKGEPLIWFQSGFLHFSDGRFSDKELNQAIVNQRYVRKLFAKLINDGNKAVLQRFVQGDTLPVEVCLVFPGWKVDYKSAFGSGVCLSSDAMVYGFVESQHRHCQRLLPKEASDLKEIFETYLRKKKAYLIEA